MDKDEKALKLAEMIINAREDGYFYTEIGVIRLYKRVLEELNKIEEG